MILPKRGNVRTKFRSSTLMAEIGRGGMAQELMAIGKRREGGLPALFAPDARTAERIRRVLHRPNQKPQHTQSLRARGGRFCRLVRGAWHLRARPGAPRACGGLYRRPAARRLRPLRSSSSSPRSGCSLTGWSSAKWCRSIRQARSGGQNMWSKKARRRCSRSMRRGRCSIR